MPRTDAMEEPSRAIRVAYGAYKLVVSPVLHAFSPGDCVYVPSCSEYAYVALVRFGVVKGGWLALRRLARCHPFAKGGLDPVPGGDRESGDRELGDRESGDRGQGNSNSARSVYLPEDHLS